MAQVDTTQRKYKAKVTRTIDGDTFYIKFEGQIPAGCKDTERVRFIGVNTPEMNKSDPEKGPDFFAQEATDFTDKYTGQTVFIEFDAVSGMRDKYERLLAYIRLSDGTLLNRKLIEEGYGRYFGSYKFNPTVMDDFEKVGDEAKKKKKGLWKGDQSRKVPLEYTQRKYKASIERTIDGDTAMIKFEGGIPEGCDEVERVRFIGVNTPEMNKSNPAKGPDFYAQEATDFTSQYNDQTVFIEFDKVTGLRDKYDRLLAYLRLPDGSLLNRRLIEGGYGRYYSSAKFEPAVMQDFAKAQESAQDGKKGIWKDFVKPKQKPKVPVEFSPKKYAVKITKVVDGDTLIVLYQDEIPEGCKESDRVKLLGVNAPDLTKKEYYAQEAFDLNSKYLNQVVFVEFDKVAGPKDKYDRPIVFIRLPDDSLLNVKLIEGGYAKFVGGIKFENSVMDVFGDAQRSAQGEKKGIWKDYVKPEKKYTKK